MREKSKTGGSVQPGARDRENAGQKPVRNGQAARTPFTSDEPNGIAGAAQLPSAEEKDGRLSPEPVNGDKHKERPSHPGVPLAPPGIVPESDVRTHSPAAARPPPEDAFSEDLGELPWSYGDGRLVCLVRDPATIYVYWDLSQQQIEQAFGGLGTARARLRIFNPHRGDVVRDVEVHLEARGWYVRDLPSALELRVELWAEGEKGARLLRAARPVKLPPSQPSDVLEEFYATLPLGQALRGEPITGGRPLAWKSGSAPPGWERRMQPRWAGSSSRAAGQSAMPWSGTVQQRPKDPEGEE
jgi:hypothetical protein